MRTPHMQALRDLVASGELTQLLSRAVDRREPPVMVSMADVGRLVDRLGEVLDDLAEESRRGQ